jgi:hypothetical protein
MTEENTADINNQPTGVELFFKNFALIVDGEVAGNYQVPVLLETEQMIAIFQSNPTIVETQDRIENGSTWDGQAFTAPV